MISSKGWVVFLLVLGTWGAPFAGAQIRVEYVEGTAEYRGDRDNTWRVLEEGQALPENGYVRTGKAAILELRKGNKARLIFSANTLARLRFDQGDELDRVLLQAGVLMTKVLALGSHFQVRTSTTALGVRGTEFTVHADLRNGAQVAVREGKVYALGRSLGGRPAGGVLLQGGQKGGVPLGELPEVSLLAPSDRDYFDFGAFEADRSERRLFDHWSSGDDRFFQDFADRDLADYQLFVLEDLDQQWQSFLRENREFAEQLSNSPLSP